MNQNQHQDISQATPAGEPAQPIAAEGEVQDLAPELDVTGGQNNLKQFAIARATQNNLKQLGLAGA
jgi:hypothetical protein